MDLSGKTALITGAAHRVGKQIALALAEAGCEIILHYHRAGEAARETAAQIGAISGAPMLVEADLRDLRDLEAMFDQIQSCGKKLRILVNSAAIMERIVLKEVDEESWRRTIDLNLKSVFFCTQHAARSMLPEGGVIVNISDIAGIRPWSAYPVHSISKAGVEMLTRVAALDLAPEIRVNAVAPGPVMKPAGMPDGRWSEIWGALPLQRPGIAADVASAVLFLCENEYITGETLVVDGGNQLI
jgi:pteridine reductase